MYVCQFSCGAASAVATKLTLADKGPANTRIVNAFVAEEHADNRRFAADCERWFQHPIEVVMNMKYQGSAKNVWKTVRYMKGAHGAPCSGRLKRDMLKVNPGDVTVIGYTLEETDRAQDLMEHFPAETFSFPLIEYELTKEACLSVVDKAGIQLPLMYRLGFQNANCIGCPKGGQNYWQKIREEFPAEFAEIAAIQENIGPGAYFLRFRSGPRKDERMSLAELPEGNGNLANEASFECGFTCEYVSQQLDRLALK